MKKTQDIRILEKSLKYSWYLISNVLSLITLWVLKNKIEFSCLQNYMYM